MFPDLVKNNVPIKITKDTDFRTIGELKHNAAEYCHDQEYAMSVNAVIKHRFQNYSVKRNRKQAIEEERGLLTKTGEAKSITYNDLWKQEAYHGILI